MYVKHILFQHFVLFLIIFLINIINIFWNMKNQYYIYQKSNLVEIIDVNYTTNFF